MVAQTSWPHGWYTRGYDPNPRSRRGHQGRQPRFVWVVDSITTPRIPPAQRTLSYVRCPPHVRWVPHICSVRCITYRAAIDFHTSRWTWSGWIAHVMTPYAFNAHAPSMTAANRMANAGSANAHARSRTTMVVWYGYSFWRIRRWVMHKRKDGLKPVMCNHTLHVYVVNGSEKEREIPLDGTGRCVLHLMKRMPSCRPSARCCAGSS